MARDKNKKDIDQTASSGEDDIYTGYTDTDSDEDFMADVDVTLESILAEFKGSAYIDGDKKTPKSVLQEKTNRIIQEAAGGQYKDRETTEEPDAPYPPLRKAGEGRPETTEKIPELRLDKPDQPKPGGDMRRLPGTDGDTRRLPKVDSDTKRLPKTDGDTRQARQKNGEPKPAKPKISPAGLSDLSTVNLAKSQEYKNEKAKTSQTGISETTGEKDVIPFDSFFGQSDDMEDEIVREVSKAIEQQTQFEQETQKSVKKAFRLFQRNDDEYTDDNDVFDSGYDSDTEQTYEQTPVVFEDGYVDEPDLNVAIKQFAEKCNMYSTRFFFSLTLSILLTILTIVFQAGVSLPFGIGHNSAVSAGILLILMFVIMIFSAEKLVDGFSDILKGRQGIETLNLFSCLATATAGIFGMVTKDTAAGMPFCAVSAFSLTFTLWSERVYYRALTESLKTVQSTSMPTGVVVEQCEDIDRSVIKKVVGKTQGFYNNLIQEDITETVFRYATPILIIAAVVLAFFSSFGQDMRYNFIHNFAAIMAAAAPFSAIMAYAVPFNAVVRRTRQSGAAVAGWGGADELFHSDGASMKDEDIFPAGTVSLGGIKIFEDVSPDKAIRYAASLIIASRSVLASLFTQLLNKQGLTKLNVEDFQCYEGGIGGTIKGERIVTGSAALMNLQGIRVPPSLNMKNGVFTAVGKKLIAVFTIDYVPVKSVQNALVSVLRYHVKLLFSVRDFNITPVMLEQKFKVPVDDVEYIPIADSYDLSDDSKLDTKRTAAVLTREGMTPYVEAIIGGRRLRFTALVATILTILSAVGGMIIMYSICMTGAFSAGSAPNLLLYMASMTAVVLIVCGFAKYRQ